MSEDCLPKYASRKLFVAIALETISVALLCMGLIPPTSWENVTTIIALGYLGAQAYVDRNSKRSS